MLERLKVWIRSERFMYYLVTASFIYAVTVAWFQNIFLFLAVGLIYLAYHEERELLKSISKSSHNKEPL